MESWPPIRPFLDLSISAAFTSGSLIKLYYLTTSGLRDCCRLGFRATGLPACGILAGLDIANTESLAQDLTILPVAFRPLT